MGKVSVLIINYNTFILTSNCIRSVIKHTQLPDYEIIVVDNASTERDPKEFLIEFPTIKLIQSTKNGGFAAGNNLGIEQASGEYILLLNSDTILEEDAISKTLTYLQTQRNVGMVGCKMVFPDGKIQYTARKFRSIKWELLDLFRFIPFCLTYKKRSRLMLGKYFRHDESLEADWLNGAFLLFDKKLLENFPQKKLDDRFFMYGEDQLWCEQLKKLDYRNHFFAGTSIIHINSGSTDYKKQIKLRQIMMKHELVIMAERKGKGLYYFFFKIIFVTKESFRNFMKRIYFKMTGKLIR
ncbi:MAG: glycosyltransferase family 2 protein [Chitinophagaceae bacterium]|nr:glycosyltransferase family 2 protein [Chitinophagaceae bacterium]